jgi:hypothetical protein
VDLAVFKSFSDPQTVILPSPSPAQIKYISIVYVIAKLGSRLVFDKY